MSNTRSNDMPMERPVLRRTSCVHCGDSNVSLNDPYRTRCQRCLNRNRNPYGTGPVTVQPSSSRQNDGRKRSAKPRRRRSKRSKRSKRSRTSKKSRVVKRTKPRSKRPRSKVRKSRSMRRKSTRPRRSRK